MRTNSNQSGFSLIELLVVCTIIGIVAALSIPLYKRAIIGAENSSTFAMIKVMLQEQTNFYGQKGRYARLDELNSRNSGNFGSTVGNTIVRSKFTFSMTGGTVPPTDAELKDGFTIEAVRTVDGAENPYKISVSPNGEIVQILP